VARWFDPVTAHFVQADTEAPQLGQPQTFDRYMYANQNPIRYNDPTGHDVGCAGHEADDCSWAMNEPSYRPVWNWDPLDWQIPYQEDVFGYGSGYQQFSIGSSGTTLYHPPVNLGKTVDNIANGALNFLTGGYISDVNGDIKLGYVPTQRTYGNIKAGIIFLPGDTGLDDASFGKELYSNRAVDLHNALKSDPNPQPYQMRTTAALTTKEGYTLVASSNPYLHPLQQSMLTSDEIEVMGQTGIHAEEKLVNVAFGTGLTPDTMYTSRPICPSCQALLKYFNIPFIGPEP
jgi:hypothetical protein